MPSVPPRAGSAARDAHLPIDGSVLRPVQPRAGWAAQGLQPAASLAQADPLDPDPGEDLAHHARLIFHHLDPGAAPARMPADVAVAVRRRTQRADCSRKSGIAPPTPAALQDAGALVLGNDALNLKQEIVFGCPTERAIEEHVLHAGPAELLNEQHLISIAPRQPVGRVHVDPVDLARGHGIAQSL